MAGHVLILAPHPDDESIIGLLPLRLQQECGWRVTVAPVTLGSRPDRRAARKRELQAACRLLGFRLRFLKDGEPRRRVQDLLRTAAPDLVVLPHARDGHPTHRSVHRLGVAALDALRTPFRVVETEYWHPLEKPNLMVAAKAADLNKLRRALACHAGEVARNDYARRLPAWMSDNVRRGTELVGGAGAAAPAIAHATLYRARRRAGGKWEPLFKGGRIIRIAAELKALVAPWR